MNVPLLIQYGQHIKHLMTQFRICTYILPDSLATALISKSTWVISLHIASRNTNTPVSRVTHAHRHIYLISHKSV